MFDSKKAIETRRQKQLAQIRSDITLQVERCWKVRRACRTDEGVNSISRTVAEKNIVAFYRMLVKYNCQHS